MLRTTHEVNYSTGGILETTLNSNYSTGGMLETNQNAIYSIAGMLETTLNAIITLLQVCWKLIKMLEGEGNLLEKGCLLLVTMK